LVALTVTSRRSSTSSSSYFSQGDLHAVDEYLRVELVIRDPLSAPAPTGRGAAIGLGDEPRAAFRAGGAGALCACARVDCWRLVSR
jgi:hypothetical protein